MSFGDLLFLWQVFFFSPLPAGTWVHDFRFNTEESGASSWILVLESMDSAVTTSSLHANAVECLNKISSGVHFFGDRDPRD